MNATRDLCAFLRTPDSRARVASTFNYLHATYPPESTMAGGEGLYSGLKLPLDVNLYRLITLYKEVGTKLRLVETQSRVRFKPLGFSDSQIKVMAFFYKLRVVFAEPGTGRAEKRGFTESRFFAGSANWPRFGGATPECVWKNTWA